MPSTYTSNLGIELPADGEQDGVWGDVVNDNMSIIDRAINGSITLSLSGTASTLTTTDGTLSDGQYKLLALGGTPSGTHTITIAPNDAQKIYFVVNGTAQSVVLTQGSGGNVTVPVGRSALVYANGGGASAAVVDFSANLVPVLSNAGVTASTAELNILDGVTSTTAELNILDGVTASTAELNILDGVTASTAELNILDGVTASTAELNFTDGVTSNIQTQLDAKASTTSPAISNSVTVSSAAPEVVLVETDGNTGFRQTAIVQTSNTLRFETRNSSGVFVGRDYVIEKSSAGAEDHIFYLNNTERFRLTTTGAIGLNGENYGTAGQVITSNGIASPPSWQTPTGAVAFGRVNGTGVISASYNLASANWYSTGACRVTFSSSLGTSAYVAIAGHYDNSAATPLFVWAYPAATATGNFVDVFLKNASGTAVTDVFQLVCFKP